MYSLKRIRTKEDWRSYRALVIDTPYTSFTLLPEWLDGYCLIPGLIKKIGYLIYDEEDVLIGGIAGVTYWLGRRITIFPSDPVIIEEFKIKHNLEPILMELFKTVKGRIHISSSVEEAENIGLKREKFPKGFYPNPGIGLVKIEEVSTDLISSFKPKVRRDIRLSQKRGVTVTLVTDKDKWFDVYKFFALNARNNRYKIRPYWMLKLLWSKLDKEQNLYFGEAQCNNEAKGVIWLIKSGESLHYIMGASKKEELELNVGYALQYWAIEFTKKLGFLDYNISIGGPQGVEKFKDDFGRQKICLSKTYVGIY